MASWMGTANTWLDGKKPKDLLQKDPAAVLHAARKEKEGHSMADDLVPPAAKININKRILKAGTPLYRIHREKYAGDAFNDSRQGDARFSPIVNEDSRVIATAYAGDSTKVAFCEVPLHDVDFSQVKVEFATARLAGLVHTELVVNKALELAELDQPGLAKMRASKKVTHCDAAQYGVTRQWAEAIHKQHKEVQGWSGHQNSILAMHTCFLAIA